MLNLIPLQYKILAGLLALTTLLGFAYYSGWAGEHDKYLAYQARVDAIAQAQIAEIARQKVLRQEALDESVKNTQIATDGISAYYKSHPVRVLQPSTCASGVSQTSDNTQSSDAASTIEYASTYRPDDTEQVASRLDQLQKLLTKYGVTVKE